MEEHNVNYVGGDVVTGSNDMRQLLFRPRAALDPYTTARAPAACVATTRPTRRLRESIGRQARRTHPRTRGPLGSHVPVGLDSRGGIRTRDLRVMSRLDGGAVRHMWLSRAKSAPADSARFAQIGIGLVPDRTSDEPLRSGALRRPNTRGWAASKGDRDVLELRFVFCFREFRVPADDRRVLVIRAYSGPT